MAVSRHAGLDFGTSNCVIGLWVDDAPRLVELDGGTHRMASALYAERAVLEAGPIDEDELARRVSLRAAAQSRAARDGEGATRIAQPLSEPAMRAAELRLMRREQARAAAGAYREQTLAVALRAGAGIHVGEEAIHRHMLEPDDGHFVRSPKNFLAADIREQQRAVFAGVVEHMLRALKERAEAAAATASGPGAAQPAGELDGVVLGRPIMFHGVSGEAGNRRALDTLETAARAAGFRQVAFQYEPVAAALDYERGLNRDQVVLVVDLGGGTTDCSVVRVGPGLRDADDRDDSLLGFAGDRVGGMDLDIQLAWRAFMPLLGKDALRRDGRVIPHALLWDAVAVNDVVAQTRFNSSAYAAEVARQAGAAREPELLARLVHLQAMRGAYRLNHLAELSKIALSTRERTRAELEFLEAGLAVEVDQAAFANAVRGQIERMQRLMREALTQADTVLDAVYVTGGTARSPVIEAAVRETLPGVEMIIGDAFESVCGGLTVWAQRLFR